MKRNPRKRKDNETGQEVATFEGHKHTMVWWIANQRKYPMAWIYS